MLTLIIFGALLALSVGAAVKVATDRMSLTTGRITAVEFVIGAVVCSFVVVPLISFTGVKIAQASATSYNEYWSGFEVSADMKTTPCTKDGPCRHEYDCDAYEVTEHYTVQVPYNTTESYTDSTGKSQTRSVTKYRSEDRTRQVTKYHSCPYVTEEHTFTVSDSLGETHGFGDHWFPTNPEGHRWTGYGSTNPRFGFGMPGLPGNVKTGEPTRWTQAHDRIAAGTPGGVTSVHSYDNYILASQTTILKEYSAAIASYRKSGLMPTPVKDVHDEYLADKVYFVGQAPADAAAWQDAATRFNGALGTEKQGDLHLIIVNSPKVTNADEYTSAVQAFWQSPELGDDALSKNGVVVVLGTTDGGKTVDWARGFTGMPKGNETLLVNIRQDLVGASLTPGAILGTPRAVLAQGKVAKVTHTDGALETIVFAANGGFVREEMKGFAYLASQIQPTGGQKFLIGFIGFLAALGVWAALLFGLDFDANPLRRTTGIAGAPAAGHPTHRVTTMYRSTPTGTEQIDAEIRSFLDRVNHR